MALDALTPLTAWVAATPLSRLMGEISWLVPAVQSVHIAAIAVVMGAVLMVDLRLLGVLGDESLPTVTGRFLPWVWGGLLVLFLTGVLMITGEPRRALQNTTFLLKIGLVVLAVFLTAFAQRKAAVWPDRGFPLRALAVGSMSLWVAIVFCGRWIAYTQDM